ncbi:hypothetical protein COO60DRAFT_1674179 [Scenedesmus sp. NREL 46B-D3]|nr:hypothetical protein COO60DRAFT_1674179 [Scenedesmus sp. NREL 46B-D3]
MVDLHFPYPACVCALGLVGTSIVSWTAVRVLRIVPANTPVSLRFFVTRIMPTGLFQALAMQLGNTAYLHLSVAFVQMLKAFTPCSTMLFAFAFKLERPTARLIASVGIITLGVVVASYGEGNFSLVGVTASVLSMLCEGLRLVMMQSLVSRRSFQPLEHLTNLTSHPRYVLASAVAGFGVNAAAMAVITLASALTLKVLGIFKDIGLVVYGVTMLGEHVGHTQVAGYGVSMVGLAWYNAIKARGAPAAAAALLPQSQAAGAAGHQAGGAAGRRRSAIGAGAVGAAAAAVLVDGPSAAAKAVIVRR